MADSSVQVRFSADIGQLTEAIDIARESLEGLGETFKTLAELAGIGLSADAFKEWIASSAEAGEKMVQMSASLGVSIPQISQLSAVAKLSGTDFEGLVLSLERLQVKLTQTGRDTSGVSQALRVLGINAKEFVALNPADQMGRLAEAFSRFADGPGKTAAAIELLGRNGAALIPILDRGREGIEELNQASERAGVVMSAEMARAFEQTAEHIHEMELALQGLSQRTFAQLNTAVDRTVVVFTHLIESINPSGIEAAANALASAIIGMVGHIEEFALRAEQAWKAMEGIIIPGAGRIGAAVDFLSAHFGQVAGYLANFVPIVNSVKGVMDVASFASDHLGKTIAGIGEKPSPFGALDADMTRLRVNIDGAQGDLSSLARALRVTNDLTIHTPPSQRQVPTFQTGGGRGQNDALRAAEVEANEEVKLAQDAAKQRELILNEELKTKQIGNAEWLTATKDALQDELQDTLSVYQQEEQLAGLKASQIAALKAKEAEAIERYNQQILQAEIKTTEAIAQQYTKLGDTIVGAFNSQLRGLLAGTTSWKTAMQNIGADLVLKLIEYFDKMAVEWIAKQFAMTTASVAGDTARTASSATAAAATAATQSTGLFATLAADAAKVFGGVFAFLAPILGPAAAGPAAASEGAVLGAGASIASAAVGGYVLSSGLANIHAGETIVPAQLSQPYQGGAGGAVHNWNITAVDAQSFAAMLANQSSVLAKTVAQAFNNNPSLRPAY